MTTTRQEQDFAQRIRQVIGTITRTGSARRCNPDLVQWFLGLTPRVIEQYIGAPVSTGILRFGVDWIRRHHDDFQNVTLHAWETALMERTFQEKRCR